jgi:hypothetical protein
MNNKRGREGFFPHRLRSHPLSRFDRSRERDEACAEDASSANPLPPSRFTAGASAFFFIQSGERPYR